MILGIWNISVVLSYVGMASAVCGMVLAQIGDISAAYACLIIAGLCDLFDGAVARRTKRNEQEKAFGVELDSLVDVVSFIALPLTIFISMGLRSSLHIALLVLFALAGIARLAYFNVFDAQEDQAPTHYTGLPLTYVALIFPIVYLLRFVLDDALFMPVFSAVIALVGCLEVLKIQVIKPRARSYPIFVVLAAVMLVLYLLVF